jgi:pyrroline-5-carboxylate reductase
MSISKKITIIGGGNLGSAIANGLLNRNFCNAEDIVITKRNTSTLTAFAGTGVTVTQDNNAAVQSADVVILAVKPYQAAEVLASLKQSLNATQIICSVVTGFSIDQIAAITGSNAMIVRAMPNTAIAIGESMTCICPFNIPEKELLYIKDLFNHLGKVTEIAENLMDAATVLGACGIAYALRYIRASIQGGIEIGFDAATATLIAAQTAKGAAELIIKTGHHPEEEIDKVTTPKGCTIAGLNEMEHQGFSSSLIKGITVSYQKIGK